MKYTKRIVLGILIVVIAILVVVWSVERGQGNDTVVSTDPIIIGFIAPLSGDAASFGETERNATEIALAEINAVGGVDGRPLEVIYEDGKCASRDATVATQKLIGLDGVNVILGGACSAETLAAAPIAEANQVILLSAFSSNPQITDAGDFIFRNSPSDSDVAKLDANTIADVYDRVALLTENTDYSVGVREVMLEIFGQRGVEVVADELYTDNSDFRTELSKLAAADPEVLYFNPGTSLAAGGLMAKQARELGIDLPIHGNFSLATPEALEVGGDALEGAVVNDGTGLSEKGLVALEVYRARYDAEPANEYEFGAAYDRVYLIADAMRSVGTESAAIRDYLYAVAFDGAVGSYGFDENGDVKGVGFVNVVIQDGEKVPYTLER